MRQTERSIIETVKYAGGSNPQIYTLDKKSGIVHVIFGDAERRHDSHMEIRIDNKLLTVDIVKQKIEERYNKFKEYENENNLAIK